MSKLRLLTVFSAHAAFPEPARLPRDLLPSLQEVAWVHHHFLHWTNVRGLSVERRGATSSALLLVFPDLSIVFHQTTIVMWKHTCSYTCGPRLQRLAPPKAVARNKPLQPRTLISEAITVSPKRSGCDSLGAHYRRNRGVDKHAATHPPQTSTQFQHSVTRPSHTFDKFDVTVSPVQWGFACAHDGGTHTGNASPPL